MNLSFPIATVIPGAFGVVIDQLAMSETEYTRSGLAKKVAGKIGKSRVYELLEELTASGLVIERQLEGSKVYSLNREHLLAAPVLQLAATRGLFLERLQKTLSEWSPKPIAAYLFGSVARGSSSVQSDVDILVIRSDKVVGGDENWLRQVFDLELTVERWTGNNAHILDYSEKQWRELIFQQQSLAIEILSEAVTILGPRIQDWKGVA